MSRTAQIWRVGFLAAILTSCHAVLAQDAANPQEPNRGGDVSLLSQDPAYAREQLHVADGYQIELFASEQDFPIGNAVALNFDNRGRMWVATMPTYPQYNPPTPPDDKIVILEDTDGDGRADKHVVFADGLHLPTGFELGDGGAYVAQQPNLMFLRDVDGDDVADQRRTVLHGFGTEDSHHAISAFTWGPGGDLYFQEGTFHHSQVETPYGPVRLHYAGVFRYRPDTHWLDVFVSYPFANPWGHVFDRWGQNFIADASGGSNYFGTAITGHLDYPHKHRGMKVFTSVVRPTAGCEIVSSRHFPDAAQGNFLVNNCIGFQGIKQHRMIEEGSGFTSEEVEPLLQSSDINFRPVDIEFGPDGALYIVDWFNPLIGHMQYSLRDERRDHNHGRVWRITAKGRPLVKPPAIDGQPIAALLELLKSYEDRTRYRVRRELRLHDPDQVAAEVKRWLAGLDPADPNYEHHRLEGLWVLQTMNVYDGELLAGMLRSPEPRARAAATRVLRYWRDFVDDPLPLLAQQVRDEHPRVRLEAVLACSFLPRAEAAEIALESLNYPSDYYLDYVLGETMRALEPQWKSAIAAGKPFAVNNPRAIEYLLGQLPTRDLEKLPPSDAVYTALLTRGDSTLAQRRTAAVGLAELRKSTAVAEILAAMRTLADRDAGDDALNNVGRVLLEQSPTDLAAGVEPLRDLATSSPRAAARSVGLAALLIADGSPHRAYEIAAQSIDGLRELAAAAVLLPEGARGPLHPLLRPLLDRLPDSLASHYDDGGPARARYLRIELPGERRTLTLAEVEAFSDGVNVAPSGAASQHSTGHGGDPRRAIDGNRSPEYGRGGQTHTEENVANPWWELDLGTERAIDTLVVWNRTESGGQHADRLDGFRVLLLDSDRRPLFTQAGIAAPRDRESITIAVDPLGPLRRSVIRALAAIPGYDVDTFAALARFVQDGVDVDSALPALGRLALDDAPRAQMPALADRLVEIVRTAEPAQRTASPAADALALGRKLLPLLPADKAQEVQRQLDDLAVQQIALRSVPHRMIFDRTIIAVQAGKPVEIAFENGDIMPHNLIITAPGKLADVAALAERMAAEPNAFERNFIPKSPDVLHATRLLATGESAKLQFTAPTEPGEYPFVCTFPGHWRTMNGVMVVANDLQGYLAEHPLPEPVPTSPPRSFVREWRFDELAALLPETDRGRSFERGRELFTAASCVTCHKMQTTGGAVGPELTILSADLADGKLRPEDILWEILEPSRKIKEKFRQQIVLVDDGRQVTGLLLSEDDKQLRLMTNPLVECEPTVIPVDAVEERIESKVSLMPSGLLNTLDEEEILDLLAYLRSGGDPNHPSFDK